MTNTATEDLDRLRERVRATQHLRSFPLLVIGALLVNYGVSNFGPHPMQWRFAAPLAFVVVWLLGRLNEARIGVGPGRADYLVAAGLVFTATNLLLMQEVFDRLTPGRIAGLWVVIVGLALAGVAVPQRDGVLLAAGLVVVAAGVALAAQARWPSLVFGGPMFLMRQAWQNELVAVTGAVLTIGGLVCYRRERGVG